MELWTYWLMTITHALNFFSSELGLGFGLSIVVLTALLRTALLPLTWTSGYRNFVRKNTMRRLQPELDRLKAECGDKPQVYSQRLIALYRTHGVAAVDWRSLAGSLLQMPLVLGMYQTLRSGLNDARFLWAGSLSRPDPWLALLVGLSTLAMMWVNPDMPEQMRLILMVLPTVLSVIVALKMCSALAVYGIVSNGYSAVQTLGLRYFIARRVRSGALSN